MFMGKVISCVFRINCTLSHLLQLMEQPKIVAFATIPVQLECFSVKVTTRKPVNTYQCQLFM